MGSLATAKCECGFTKRFLLGGGMSNHLTYCGFPCYCQDCKSIFEANLFGWHTLTRLALPIMFAQKSGRIIQNSSVLGFAAMQFRGAYVATKFALEGLTDTMRLELRGTGIDVILIEPGPNPFFFV